MKRESRTMVFSLFFLICLSFVAVANGFCEEYEALRGLKSVKAVFDVRIGDPKSAALHLKLIQETFKDRGILSVTKKPVFVVVFIGPSVKLISKNRDGFSPDDQKALDEIASTVSAMTKSGIRLESCLVAAHVFGVDPASILPGIKRVPNGWVSLIGYEAKNYSLVPAY
jgi:intracellular sulfur oxidation DsrE/DsrF family protein